MSDLCDGSINSDEDRIGSGTYGTIFDYKDHMVVKINRSMQFNKFLTNIIELDTLTKLGKHPNILSLLGVCRTENLIENDESKLDIYAMIFEKASHGDLWELPKDFFIQHIKHILTDCLLSLEYIHELGFIHRDIKMHNFLYFPDNIKLIDFGSCIQMNENSSKCQQYFTLEYKPPNSIVSQKNDIWALFNSILDKLSANKYIPIFPKVINYQGELDLIVRRKYIEFLGLTEPDLLNIFLKSLRIRIEEIPSATELLNLPYFEQFREKINLARLNFPPKKFKITKIENFSMPIYDTVINKLKDIDFRINGTRNEQVMKLFSNLYQRYIIKKNSAESERKIYSALYLTLKYLNQKNFSRIRFINLVSKLPDLGNITIEDERDIIEILNYDLFYDEIMF